LTYSLFEQNHCNKEQGILDYLQLALVQRDKYHWWKEQGESSVEDLLQDTTSIGDYVIQINSFFQGTRK